jgi:hypothetical protein
MAAKQAPRPSEAPATGWRGRKAPVAGAAVQSPEETGGAPDKSGKDRVIMPETVRKPRKAVARPQQIVGEPEHPRRCD